MGKFSNLTTDDVEQSEDRVGGFSPLESDIYDDAEIKLAYAGESAKGAQSITIHAAIGDREYRETIYITNRNGDNFWLNDNKKKMPLPGFTVINDLCICATGAPLSEQDTDEKQVKIYDFDERKEVPKAVDVLVDLIGKKVTLGILNTLENKGVKQSDGSYADGPEERNVNSIDKVFENDSKMTVREAMDNEGWDADKAEFIERWRATNEGKTRDKRTIKDGQGGQSGRPSPGGNAGSSGGGEKRSSLFSKK